MAPRCASVLTLLLCLSPLSAGANAPTGAIGPVGEPAPNPHTEQLVDALLHDAYYKVRLQAALLLGRSGTGAAFLPLLQALRVDAHVSVRAAAAAALGELGDIRAVTPLVQQSALDPESLVREAAQQALAHFPRAQALPQVLTAYSAAEPEVRRAVFEFVGVQPPANLEPLLLRGLADVPEVARLAQALILRLPPAAGARLLEAAVVHRDAEVRRGALDLLRLQGTTTAAQLVLSVYEREAETEGVRDAARLALRQLQGQLPVADWVTASGRGDRHGRAHALRLLGVVGGAVAQARLLAALADPDAFIRGSAVVALQDLGATDVIPALELLASHPDNQRIDDLVQHTLAHLRRLREPSASVP